MILFSLFYYDQSIFPKTIVAGAAAERNHATRRRRVMDNDDDDDDGNGSGNRSSSSDRIDHALKWMIKIGLFVLFFTLPDLYDFTTTTTKGMTMVVAAEEIESTTTTPTRPGEDFFHLCSSSGVTQKKKKNDDNDTDNDDVDKFRNILEMNPHWVHSRTDNGETCLHLTGIYGNSDITELLLDKKYNADPNVRTTYKKGLRMHPLSWNVYGGHLVNIQLLLENGADINLDFDSMDSKSDTPIVTSLDVLLELIQNESGDERFLEIEKVFTKYGAKTMEQIKNESKKQGNDDDDNDDIEL